MTGPLAVLDIDGTVADARHRLPLINGRPTHADWVKFFDAAAADPVLPAGAEVARQLAADHEIVWLTGRPDRIRELTRHWLSTHHLPAGRLLMHPTNDQRLARTVKLDQLRALAREHHIAVVIDDDPRVVQLLQDEGFPAQLATWLPWTPGPGSTCGT